MDNLRTLLFCFFSILACNVFAKDPEPYVDSVTFFTNQLPPQLISNLESFHQYSRAVNQSYNFGVTNDSYCYILLKVRGTTKGSFLFSIDNTSLDTVLIYRILPNGAKQLLYQGGNLIKYNTRRSYVWHTAPILNEQHTLYLFAAKAVSQNVNLKYLILKEEDLKKVYQSFDRLIYFYAGFVLLMSFVCMVGAFLFKKKVLWIYAVYILAVACWILGHYGYLFPSLYPSFPVFNRVVKQLASLFAILSLAYLITYAFKIEYKKRSIRQVLMLLKIVTSLLILLYFSFLLNSIDLTAINIIWNVHLLVSAAIISLVLSSFFRSNDTAKLFFVAIGFILLAAFFQVTSNAGWVHIRFLDDHAMLIASLLEMITLTIGIFYSIWKEKLNQENELKFSEQERNRALEMLILVQDDERKRIAADLHDSIGPLLAAIKINFLRLSNAKLDGSASRKVVQKTESIIDEAIAEMRNIAHRLMPKGLSSKGLIALLNDYFANLETIYDLSIHFEHNICVSLNHELQVNLYRIVSELSLNGAKHSEAKNLLVSITTEVSQTIVIVKDNGKGFQQPGNDIPTMGLRNVKSRVEYLGGKIDLKSSENGTIIEIWIPNSKTIKA